MFDLREERSLPSRMQLCRSNSIKHLPPRSLRNSPHLHSCHSTERILFAALFIILTESGSVCDTTTVAVARVRSRYSCDQLHPSQHSHKHQSELEFLYADALSRLRVPQTLKLPSAGQFLPGIHIILSVDGGGIRGVSIIIVLMYVMKMLCNRLKRLVQPWQKFDNNGGIGTGGFIALMLDCMHVIAGMQTRRRKGDT